MGGYVISLYQRIGDVFFSYYFAAHLMCMTAVLMLSGLMHPVLADPASSLQRLEKNSESEQKGLIAPDALVVVCKVQSALAKCETWRAENAKEIAKLQQEFDAGRLSKENLVGALHACVENQVHRLAHGSDAPITIAHTVMTLCDHELQQVGRALMLINNWPSERWSDVYLAGVDEMTRVASELVAKKRTAN